MASITAERVTKVYPNGFKAVTQVDLKVDDGEFMVLVGPSGCGKTTLLRMIAGLEDISAGILHIGGKPMNEVGPKDRDIAMVFQNYALYPHMTVAENIGFSLKLHKLPNGEIDRKVRDAAATLGLTEWLERKPGQLSGGQRQRVAMGRAIVREPAAFLMDEPLSNLDAKLRVQMRSEVRRVQRRIGVATVYVTHDQIEAMTMGDRVAVMRDGVIQQCAIPQDLYDRPCNVFVAAFIGSPSMNLFEAVLNHDGTELRLGSQTVPVPPTVEITHPRLVERRGAPVVVGIRPEHLSASGTSAGGPRIQGEVDLVEALGSEQLVHFTIDAKRIKPDVAEEATEALTESGEGIARLDPRAPMKPGSREWFAISMDSAHFFDTATGIRL